MSLTRLRSPYDRDILRLAIPAFGALIAEPVYLLADSAIVGHLGTPQLAALGLAGTALQTLVGVFVFLAYATTASVARHLGAGDRRSALAYGIDGLWLALGLGVLLALVGTLAAPAVVGAFGPSPQVHEFAVTYLRVAVLGMPALLLTFAGTGVLRGLQDTRTPLWIAGASYVGNVVLNVLFVYGLHLGIAGSAWGTVLAQTAGAVALVVVVVRAARRHGAPLKPDLPGIRASAHAGVPLIIRTLTLRAALLVTAYVATSFGDVSLAANQVAFTLWNTLAIALDAIAIAGQAIVGRYLGGSDVAGTRAATRRMVEWGIGAGVVFGAVVVLARPVYVPLFSADPAVQALLAQAVLVFACFEPVAGIVFVLDGVLIGAGDGKYLAYAGLMTLVAFLPLAVLVYATHAGLLALWWAFGGFMVARLVTLAVRARGDAWLVTGAGAARR
ncbi:putative efflux protein, MATE family [Actinopolymorpha cephalotaxi]|uniref:MATE family efflux protein n=1 Tax=Actinopolymorpha cephalotaxi TaxID=504797 RepID=A0A1I2UIA8_9ACTN|nr:MATE family efflux transporter [Actinopolymorpha cephalotaxi]NYH86607.1 putative MATE family efflux protein [Actinopolymorpha cephalotaxi]SFG76882.1 putative efflux protein, MATE family [Actinopolymorpha cephalotaxi]